jgi:hypothetical protein
MKRITLTVKYMRTSLNVRKTALLLATMAALLMGVPVSAQVNTGRISGAVTDQSGGVIVGATVNIIDVARGESRPLTTDSAGLYAAPNLTPGIYTVRAEAQGFQVFQRQNVEVTVGSDVRVDLILQPGSQNQTVTVTESLPIIDATNAQTGGVLENKLIQDLPTIGRNYRWMQSFVPGVLTGLGNTTGGFNVDVNGTTDGHGTDSMVDGLYQQNYFTSEVTFGGSGESGFTTVLPLDAIQEVNLVVNPKAEYGWIPGVTTSIGIKSGTNEIHGDAYAYGRDDALQARNPFASGQTPLSFEQFGATAGGPLKKNKLFYFMGYEGFRESAFSVVNQQAPTTDVLPAGKNATGLSIPDAIADINAKGKNALLSQLSLNLAGCNPALITSTMTTGAQVAAAGACNANQFGALSLWNNPSAGLIPENGRSDNGLFKLDYHINDHHALNGAFAYGNYFTTAAGNKPASITQNYWEEVLSVIGSQARIVEIWTPNSAWLNEARWGRDSNKRPVGRAECALAPNGDINDPVGIGVSGGGAGGPDYLKQYGLLSGAPGCGIPTIVLTSPVAAQLGFSNDRIDNEVDTQGADSASYTHGAHQFKFGVDIRAISFTGAKVLDAQSGVITFGQGNVRPFSGATSLEDFLTGMPSSESIRAGSPVRSISTNLIGLFAQDDWRITPRITLNLGLREEIVTPPTSPTDNLGNFSPASPTGMVAVTRPFSTHYNFEPRLGVAWDVTGKGRTTVRAGAGVLTDLLTLMNLISGGSATRANYDNVPTGETLYNAAGVPVVAPGNGKSAFVSPLPAQIIWPKTNSSTTPLFPTPIPAACGNGLGGNPNPCIMSGGDPELRYYRYYFWNVNFQHAFTNNLSLDVGYVGSRTNGIVNTVDLNEAAPTDDISLATPDSEQLRAPFYSQFPWYSNILYLSSAQNDNFRSLQVHLVERASRGLTFSTSYTYEGNYLTQGVLNINVPVVGTDGPYSKNLYPAHNLSVQATYQIPGIKSPGQILQGWELHANVGAVSSQSVVLADTKDDLTGSGTAGTPWTLSGPADPFNKIWGLANNIPCYGVTGITTSSFKNSPCTQEAAGPASAPWANLPPACIEGAQNEASFPGATAGTNTQDGLPLYQLAATGCYALGGSAIVPPAQGTYGTMLDNAIRSRGQILADASATKNWKITERFTAQFRAEVFNLLNRTQYIGASTDLGSPSRFGLAVNTPDVARGDPIQGRGGPRYFQFGLKLLF